MKISYVNKYNNMKSETDKDVSFFLINDEKDFLSFYGSQRSRYEGFFVKSGTTFTKILSRIILSGESAPTSIVRDIDNDLAVSRVYDSGLEESYRVAQNDKSLVYELSQRTDFLVRLDVRDIFDIPHWNRKYEVKSFEGGIVVKYQDDKLKNVFTAFVFKGSHDLVEGWRSVEYSEDKARKSDPFISYEFELARVRTRKMAVGVSDTMGKAIALAKDALKKRTVKPPVSTAIYDEKDLAYRFCLDTLVELDRDGEIVAGLPWFGKSWTRDELLSALALPLDTRVKIIRKYLNLGRAYNGSLPIIAGGKEYCDDSIGILAWLVSQSLGEIREKDKILLAIFFEKAEKYFEKKISEEGLIVSTNGYDWMDTVNREGYLIEIQALYIQILNLLFSLTNDDMYDFKKKQIVRAARKHLSGGFILDDGKKLDKRPNTFLAAFFAPELFEKGEWERTFDFLLTEQNLWNAWGGLSSLGHKDEGYSGNYTGEDNVSYHAGDSWFFVNNITAIVLYRFDREKYRKFIEKIFEASTDNILWQQAVGRPSEISSSNKFAGEGSCVQAFSAATYVYLYRTIHHTSLDADIRKIKVRGE